MGAADALFDGSNAHMLETAEAGSPDHKAGLYLERKKDVLRVAKIISPYLLEEADKADEQDLEEVMLSVSSVYSALNVIAFIESLDMYEKELREEMDQLIAEVERLKVEAKQSRCEGQMEALDAVFQINGPSRAITRLKGKYAAEAVGL